MAHVFPAAVALFGFQCQLSKGGVYSPAPLHAWQPCSAPVSVSGLSDGTYLFEVRAAGKSTNNPFSATKYLAHAHTHRAQFCRDPDQSNKQTRTAMSAGYTIQDQQIFTVDTIAPVASITAASAPVPGAKRSAAFAFTAQDASPVDFSCRLHAAPREQPLGAAVLNIGLWLPCTSAQVQHAMCHHLCDDCASSRLLC